MAYTGILPSVLAKLLWVMTEFRAPAETVHREEGEGDATYFTMFIKFSFADQKLFYIYIHVSKQRIISLSSWLWPALAPVFPETFGDVETESFYPDLCLLHINYNVQSLRRLLAGIVRV
jgi:hypothetical protein